MYRKAFGNENVPVIEAVLPVTCQLYRNVFRLSVGQHFNEASIAPKQSAHYQTLGDGRLIPVEALVARQMCDNHQADYAVFTECWMSRVVIFDTTLTCVAAGQCRTRLYGDTPVKEVLHQIQDLNGGTLAGIPDVIALGRDGHVFLRDVKRAGKDRVAETQHRFARSAKRLLGTRLDLAIVEFQCA
jgi:hypothetical protein